MGRRFVELVALGVAMLALAACGDGEDSTDTGKKGGGASDAGTLNFETDPGGSFAYTTKEASANPGTLTIKFTNRSSAAHDVRIEASGGAEVGGVDVISEGRDASTVVLKPGDYTFYCSLEGHRQAGMEGTLTIK